MYCHRKLLKEPTIFANMFLSINPFVVEVCFVHFGALFAQRAVFQFQK